MFFIFARLSSCKDISSSLLSAIYKKAFPSRSLSNCNTCPFSSSRQSSLSMVTYSSEYPSCVLLGNEAFISTMLYHMEAISSSNFSAIPSRPVMLLLPDTISLNRSFFSRCRFSSISFTYWFFSSFSLLRS